MPALMAIRKEYAAARPLAGARIAGGCTSGHSIVGVAQRARSSLAATAMFMVGGFVTTQLVRLAAGL